MFDKHNYSRVARLDNFLSHWAAFFLMQVEQIWATCDNLGYFLYVGWLG